jgi:hypothetical protein
MIKCPVSYTTNGEIMKSVAFLLTCISFVCSAVAADKKYSVIVLDFVEVKDGQGCTQATLKSKFPMTSEQCEQFLARNGLPPRVDTRNPMMQMRVEAVVPKGTAFVYVFTKDFTGWVFADRN